MTLSDRPAAGEPDAAREDAPLSAQATDHFLAPEPQNADRRRFLAVLAACLLVHALILAVLFYEGSEPPEVASVEEIPVELVQEPPPPQEQTPPPAPPPALPPPVEEEKPVPPQAKTPPKAQKLVNDYKPAFDAPKEANNEEVERKAPERQETRARREADPKTQAAVTPSQETQNAPSAPLEGQQDEASDKPPDERPDAEALDKATPVPVRRPQEKKAPSVARAAPGKDKKTLAEEFASLAPTPDYRLGAAPRPSPVGGGRGPATYMTVLYGLIMPKLKIPPDIERTHQRVAGVISFYIDPRGNLTHQAVYRASGRPDLDQAAMSAVRRSAPFPPPPDGQTLSIIFTYGSGDER